jgi:hypothetical protein
MFALSTIPAEAQHHHGGWPVTVIPHSPLLWGGGFGFYGGVYSPIIPASVSGIHIRTRIRLALTRTTRLSPCVCW